MSPLTFYIIVNDIQHVQCSSYSCCVDEVAAEHYSADSIIHYGRSCLSPTERLPVLFVFGKGSIDVQDCVQKFSSMFADTGSKLILMYDVIFYHAAGMIFIIHDSPNWQ